MGTIEYSQPASKSSWDSQDFGDISMMLKWPILASPPGHDELIPMPVKLIFISKWGPWVQWIKSESMLFKSS